MAGLERDDWLTRTASRADRRSVVVEVTTAGPELIALRRALCRP
jgi:DNA-binding MarR family transcriptional regulator